MNVFTVTVSDAFGSAFCERLEHAARHVSADIVWIDPLFSFMGGDAMRQAEVSEFLRQGLQPILARNDFGLIVCHHENKPPRQDARTAWSDGDHAYAGSGSSELANWPRGVLVLSPVPDATGVFRLIGAKRGSRLGWRDHLGIPTTSRYLRHASDGTISWEEVAQPEVAKKTAPHTRDDFLAHVPEEGTIPKTTLIQKASSEGNRRKIGQTACRGYLDELIKEGVLYEHHEKRSGTNPMKLISRQPPPPIEAGNEDPEAPNTAQG